MCDRHVPGEPFVGGRDCRVCWLYHNDERYRTRWQPRKTLSDPAGKVQQKSPEPPKEGPGTELKALLKSLGIEATEGCSCNKRMRLMDEWGVQGCRDRRAEIVAWLQEERDKRGWGAVLSAAVLGVSQGLWLNPFDLLGSLVDEAIKRAEKKG